MVCCLSWDRLVDQSLESRVYTLLIRHKVRNFVILSCRHKYHCWNTCAFLGINLGQLRFGSSRQCFREGSKRSSSPAVTIARAFLSLRRCVSEVVFLGVNVWAELGPNNVACKDGDLGTPFRGRVLQVQWWWSESCWKNRFDTFRPRCGFEAVSRDSHGGLGL